MRALNVHLNDTQIFYYSRYGHHSFTYIDRYHRPLHITKYVPSTLQHFYDRVTRPSNSFILSGSPSSIIELIDFGFDRVTPTLIILSGENCPIDVRDRILKFCNTVLNIYVAREFGVLGVQCLYSSIFHLFSNCFYFALSDTRNMTVTDPTNYCQTYNSYPVGDQVDYLNKANSKCGIHSQIIANLTGRPYGKPYPAL